MTKRAFGQRVKRREDSKLLRGLGCYTDDIDRGALEAHVIRSPHAHARVRSIDVSRAASAPGVVKVYTAADLPFRDTALPLLIPHPCLHHPRTQKCLADDIVRYVGEAIALIVAENRYLAEDAADLVEVDYDPLLAVVRPEVAAESDVLVHADVPGNVAGEMIQEVGDVEAALRSAPRVLRRRFRIERSAAHPMEGRAVWAAWDAKEGRLLVYDSTQSPTSIRGGLAALFNLPETSVDVVAPDVGGGFGVKIMLFYPEEILVPFAAMDLRRPVKWTEDRHEHFVAANQERAQVHDVTVGFDDEGHLLALDDDFIHDGGAYTPYGMIIPIVTAGSLVGPYRIPNLRIRFRDVYTTTTPTSPYRGAGQPHACFVMERTIDAVAADLGLDRAEARRRNLIQPDELPYETGVRWSDGGWTTYDSGNFPALLETCLEKLGARPEGENIGLGLAMHVEGTGPGPYEGAHVQVLVNGQVIASTGLPSQGQSHETVFAQIVADELGVRTEDVAVRSGDTRWFKWAVGTFSSRAAVTAGNAMRLAAAEVASKARRIAGVHLEAHPGDLELVDGTVRVRGTPARALPLATVAILSNPLRYAFGRSAEIATQFTPERRGGPPLSEGEQPGLEATRYFSPPGTTWASACHAAWVSVDPNTYRTKVVRYVVVHDCGRLINPLVVEGQIQGGLAQGVGGSLYERLLYDSDGQLRNASYKEFLIPYSSEVPEAEIYHQESPSPLNPLGVKGAGEAGTIPVAALFAGAIEDALKVTIDEMPVTPDHLFHRHEEAMKRQGLALRRHETVGE